MKLVGQPEIQIRSKPGFKLEIWVRGTNSHALANQMALEQAHLYGRIVRSIPWHCNKEYVAHQELQFAA
jgi:hypothetical protein